MAHIDPEFINNFFSGLIKTLFGADLVWIARSILRIMRWKWRNRLIQAENATRDKPALPTGPFATTRENQLGDLLLWVPRRMESYIIDDLTGGYGYSHSTLDTGEIDLPTQKPVMIEILQGQTVARKFQDQYPQRPFARVPISKTGINSSQLVDCAKEKMGNSYDNFEVISMGKIQDPAREVCSGLIADCLPVEERIRIATARKKGFLRKASVMINSKIGSEDPKESISPNGLAQYYGAPKGRKLSGPDILIDPKPIDLSIGLSQNWKTAAGALGILTSAAIVILLFSSYPKYRKAEIQLPNQRVSSQ